MLRIGNSIDIHNLIVDKCMQKLGGVSFESEFKVQAHSDGDVILHAVSEAILGALGLGDLGEHFSDQLKSTEDMDSEIILDYSLNKMNESNFELVNLDLSVVCDKIIFLNKKEQIKNFLIKKFNNSHINIKATRFEDKTNMKISCFCSLLLESK